MTITLADGTVYKNMDCTPNEDTEAVVTGEDIPAEAQQRLYGIYKAWRDEQASRQLKDCFSKGGKRPPDGYPDDLRRGTL